jgi:hypothetical protein
MTPEKQDWRAHPDTVRAAVEIIEFVTEACSPLERLPVGRQLKVRALLIVKVGFFKTFDEAVARISSVVEAPKNQEPADVLAGSLDEPVCLLAEATGASPVDIVEWMRSQFQQAFDRKISAAK